ncbi:MAG: DUF4340 domain-containing protein [Phycisphaerales bacterium]
MWRRAIIAWFVAAALVAVGAALRGGAPPSAGSAAPGSAGQPVVAEGRLPVDRVDGVTVTRGGHTLQFRREGDGWWQVAPWRQPAEAAALRDVLLRLADLRATRRVDGGGAELGLDPPEAQLEVTWPDGRVAVALGRRSVGGRAWARGPDGAAWSVDPALHDAILDADLREWRSWRLFEGAGVEGRRVEILRTPLESSRPPSRLVLERRDGRWSMIEPARTRVDAKALEAVVTALARVRHSGFVDESPADLALYGLARPIAAVAISGGTPAVEERVEIGSAVAEGGMACGRRTDRPPVFLLDAAALQALLPPPAAFVEPTGCGVAPADVERLRIVPASGSGAPWTLRRTLDGWLVAAEGAAESPASGPAVESLLARLCTARAGEIALQAPPKELLLATVEVWPIGASRPVTLRVAREGPGGKWAIDESDDVLRVFPPSFGLELDPGRYRVP